MKKISNNSLIETAIHTSYHLKYLCMHMKKVRTFKGKKQIVLTLLGLKN